MKTKKLNLNDVVILSNKNDELVPAIIVEFRYNIDGNFVMVKIGNETDLVAIPINDKDNFRSDDENEYEIDYVVTDMVQYKKDYDE